MAKTWFLALALTLAAIGCGSKEPEGPPPRESIGSMYVTVPELQIRAKPDTTSEVLSTYNVGETASVLSEKGDWFEIRIGMEGSGWAPASALSKTRQEGSTSEVARFSAPPNTVYTPTPSKGEILMEASVNTDGDVLEVKTISNTTGNAALAAKNEEALRSAKFYPMMDHGRAKPFVYMHRVTY